ncbi:hypothetical protein [Acidiphilium angustum]|uniref:hypothetical protein n=1 Tax=Acidiphilium angustum TaxID=523 RepID=UPI0004942F6C|nr:hypothetical protein [Acidiphilium angustum]
MRYIYQVKRAPLNSRYKAKASALRYSMHRRELPDRVSGFGCAVPLCGHNHLSVDDARCCETIQIEMRKAFGTKWAPSFPPPEGGLIENLPNVELSAFDCDGKIADGDTSLIMVSQSREPDDIANVKAAIADHVAASVAEPEPEKATAWQRFVKAKLAFESVLRDLFPAGEVLHFQLNGQAIERVRELSGLPREMSDDEAAELAGTLAGRATEPDAAPCAKEPESEHGASSSSSISEDELNLLKGSLREQEL